LSSEINPPKELLQHPHAALHQLEQQDDWQRHLDQEQQGDNETRSEGSEETGMYEVVTVEVKPVDAIASEKTHLT
jgi:hypothetical protein